MFSLLWDDADQYLGFVGVPKPPVECRSYFLIYFYWLEIQALNVIIFLNCSPGTSHRLEQALTPGRIFTRT